MPMRLLAMIVAIFLAAAPLGAQDAPDVAEFQRIISEQIAAFNADDGAKAYSYAAPSIQRNFPTPEIFMGMVAKGYAPVYRQRSFAFGETATDPVGRPAQHVTIIDVNGKAWTALYSMEKQPDGSWKIVGCMLVEMPGADA